MDKQSNSPESLEQFYRLLSEYGLTGKTQPAKRQQRNDNAEAKDVFPD